MTLPLAAYGLGFVEGMLSTLSPCVLPLIPIVMASAASVHRRAPLALAAGLALSYGVIGSGLAWAGSTLDLDTTWLRSGGAMLIALLGLVLLSERLQEHFSSAVAGLGGLGHRLIDRMRLESLSGQFVIGLVLGLVWSPCVGPVLGAALAMSSQASQLPQAMLLMLVFGLGASLPLLMLAKVGQGALRRRNLQFLRAGQTGKFILGGIMLVLGVLIFTGWDKLLEAQLVEVSPAWLTTWATSF